MVALREEASFTHLQHVVGDVYGLPNDRWFDLGDMITNVHRFSMRGVKAIRKQAPELADLDLAIALSWFMSTANRLNLRIDQALWDRFQYRCWYCQGCPCACPQMASAPTRPAPRSIDEFQTMFNEIYPPTKRTDAEAVAHMAEELGELAEAILMYRTRHTPEDLKQVELEAADFVSCLFGVYNSLGRSLMETLLVLFADNCHECNRAPCICEFNFVLNYSRAQEKQAVVNISELTKERTINLTDRRSSRQ